MDERIYKSVIDHSKRMVVYCEVSYGRAELLQDALLRRPEVNDAHVFLSEDHAAVFLVIRAEDGIYVVARGTNVENRRQVIANCKFWKIYEEGIGRVHIGLREQIDKVWHGSNGVYACIQDFKCANGTRIFCGGHSQGGGLAQLAAVRIIRAARRKQEPFQVGGCCTFNSMRAGDRSFAEYLEHGMRVDLEDNFFGRLHWRFHNDIVSVLPPKLFGYADVGGTIYVKPTKNGPDVFVDPSFFWRAGERLRSLSNFVLFSGLKDHSLKKTIAQLERL